MNVTSGSWNADRDIVVKSARRVPIAITRSAFAASRLAAMPPLGPIGPAFHSWFQGRAPLPACVSQIGIPNPSQKSAKAAVAPE